MVVCISLYLSNLSNGVHNKTDLYFATLSSGSVHVALTCEHVNMSMHFGFALIGLVILRLTLPMTVRT